MAWISSVTSRLATIDLRSGKLTTTDTNAIDVAVVATSLGDRLIVSQTLAVFLLNNDSAQSGVAWHLADPDLANSHIFQGTTATTVYLLNGERGKLASVRVSDGHLNWKTNLGTRYANGVDITPRGIIYVATHHVGRLQLVAISAEDGSHIGTITSNANGTTGAVLPSLVVVS
jgi:hypothetical protein